MTYQWHVWLHGERKMRIVATKLDIPLHAVAAAMDQAGSDAKQQVQADRIELLEDDGSVKRVWRKGL